MKSRAQLVELMDALEADIPAFIAGVEPSERLEVFADRAIAISQAAGPDDAEYVDRRLKGLIDDYGLDPLGESREATPESSFDQGRRQKMG